jgi:hypothetical protein
VSRRRKTRLALAEPLPMREAEKPKAEPRIGYDGVPQALGHWETEYHADLKKPESRIARFNEVRTGDGSVVAALEKLWWPVARATMDATLAGDERSETAAELFRANILRAGAPGSESYRMLTPWRQFLWECFTAESFGHSVHEVTTRVQPGPLGTFRVIHQLAWIHPGSIYQFHCDRDGVLQEIVQRFQARWWEDGKEESFYIDFAIPVRDEQGLRLFVRTRKQEGSNVEGTALIRGMYADAKRNQSMRNWQAIHAQRVAVGIPKVTITGDAPPQVQQTAIDMAKSMRGGAQDRLYVVEAPGVSVGWVQNDTGALDLGEMLRAGEERTRGVASLEWAGLGQAGSAGSRAVGDVQQRPFWLMVEGIAEGIVEDIQVQLVEMLHARNFADAPPPKLRVADVSPISIDEIAKAVDAGLIVPTAQDSNDIRRALKLRVLTPEEMAKQEAIFAKAADHRAEPDNAMPPGQPGVNPFAKRPDDAKPEDEQPKDAPAPEELAAVELAAKPKREPRAPTPFEAQHVALDDIRRCFEEIEREAAQSLRAARDAAIDESLDGGTNPDGTERPGVAIKGTRVTVPRPKDAKAALVLAMRALKDKAREIGRESMRSEVRSQVAGLTPKRSLAQRTAEALGLADRLPPFDPFEDKPRKRGVKGVVQVADAISEELETVLALHVESILDAVVKGIKREMASALAQEMSDEEAIEAARRALKDRSDVPLEQAGREMASRGINGGRAEVVEQAIESLVDEGYAIEIATRSAVLDNNTCDECEALDGTQVEVASDEYFQIMPPARCDGGAYCRCIYTMSVERKS